MEQREGEPASELAINELAAFRHQHDVEVARDELLVRVLLFVISQAIALLEDRNSESMLVKVDRSLQSKAEEGLGHRRLIEWPKAVIQLRMHVLL